MKVQSVWVLNIIQHPRQRRPTPVSKSHSSFYFLPPACEILMCPINCPKSMEIILGFKYYLLRWHAGTDFWIKHTPFIAIDCYRLLPKSNPRSYPLADCTGKTAGGVRCPTTTSPDIAYAAPCPPPLPRQWKLLPCPPCTPRIPSLVLHIRRNQEPPSSLRTQPPPHQV